MSDPRHELGRKGEGSAAACLVGKGMKVLEANYRSRVGEIDLIARDRKTYVFIEVKTRKGSGYISPLYAVNRAKQKRIIRAAQFYMKEKKLNSHTTPCRFDVVTVIDDEGRIEHIRGAFRP